MKKMVSPKEKWTAQRLGLENVDNTADKDKNVKYAESAGNATKATQDSNGNNIAETYAPKASPVFTGDVSLGRKDDTTVGDASVAIGYLVEASGKNSQAFGGLSVASGLRSHAEGSSSQATAARAHAEGNNTTASGANSHAEGNNTTALANQHAQGHYNSTATATENSAQGTSTGTAFVIGNGTSSSRANAFRVTGEGKIYATNATVNTGADYAEYFEWADGNPDSEDRVGCFVTFDEENPGKIRIADEDDYILGIVSGMPNVIGNGDECWKKRYLLDDFGRYITETFEYEDENENGEKVIKTVTKWKESPDYNPEEIYIPRDSRQEWSAIGMLGVLSVWDDGTCKTGGFCKCTTGGIATAVNEKGYERYKVIQRVTENIVKVVLK